MAADGFASLGRDDAGTVDVVFLRRGTEVEDPNGISYEFVEWAAS